MRRPFRGTATLGVKAQASDQFVTCSARFIWELEPISLQPGVGVDDAFTVDQTFAGEIPFSNDGNTWWCAFETSREVRPGTWNVRATAPGLWSTSCELTVAPGQNLFNGAFFTLNRPGCVKQW